MSTPARTLPAADSAPLGNTVTLSGARALLRRSRLFGRVSALFFLLAALAVVDGLQTLMRHEFNTLDLVPGESVLLSGMLPADAKSHDDLVFTLEGASEPVFEPLETYKGFWMGGHMWRARLEIPASAVPGNIVLTVRDIIKEDVDGGAFDDERDRSILYGGQQNPALIFGIAVWESAAARQAADISLIRRWTGFPAFGLAAGALFFALACGIANWAVFRRAEAALAGHGVFFIHGIKELTPESGAPATALSGYKAFFAHAGSTLEPGTSITLMDRDWHEKSRGYLLEADAHKGYALFPGKGERPQYGWLAAAARDRAMPEQQR